ncbi:MAG: GNAT family N-acetyltransferase, partial [Gammaproteobacteria bacterium]
MARPFSLEPESLLRQFAAHPPEKFRIESAGDGVPVFALDFAVLTTATPAARALVQRLPGAARWTGALKIRARVAGATVSEYFPVPAGTRPAELVASLKARHAHQCGLLVLKDIPGQSPLLDAAANSMAAGLLRAAKSAGFTLMQGQALAYVPVD